MTVDIPTDATGLLSFYSQVTTLDGSDFNLRFEWNSREQDWYIAIADQDDVAIVGFQKLVPEWRLLRRIVDPRRPPGELFLFDVSGKGLKPGFTELGTRCLLVYVEAADVPGV